jgi:GDSL-like lipase/acylhydrolase family protein
MNRSRWFAITMACALMTAAACTSPSETPPAPTATSTSASEPLTLVALGDSWPEGAHCGLCEPFPARYADGIRAETGRTVEFAALAGQAQPFFENAAGHGGGTASLLRALDEAPDFAEQVASGDVIVIATGPNELGRAFRPYANGACGPGFACVDRLERFWEHNFQAILDKIETLRAGKPTAIRLVTAANFFVSDPEATKGLPPDALEFGAAVFEALATAACNAAAADDAVCVDVRPILNGPTLDEPVDENSVGSMQAVADGLLETGLAEIDA